MEPVRRPAFERVVILGHGLIGGSIALAAAKRLPAASVRAFDRGEDISAAADADLVVLATPISEILGLLPALARLLPATTLITDTGSTKTAIVRAAAGMRFIGGHPIAGAEVSGRAAARPDLFTGRNWILTPADETDPGDLAALEHFVRTLGAHPRSMAAEEHDRLFAFVSHLPQLVASALMDVVGSRVGEDGLALAGDGLRDTVRLATSPPAIWRDIVHTNQPDVSAALDDLIAVLTTLRDDSSGGALTRTFDGAARWKSTLDAGRYNR
jgi:prephenate dehydrogenase